MTSTAGSCAEAAMPAEGALLHDVAHANVDACSEQVAFAFDSAWDSVDELRFDLPSNETVNGTYYALQYLFLDTSVVNPRAIELCVRIGRVENVSLHEEVLSPLHPHDNFRRSSARGRGRDPGLLDPPLRAQRPRRGLGRSPVHGCRPAPGPRHR